jgi:hypothetical protein
MTSKVGKFVRVNNPNLQVGVVVKWDTDGGVYRGHCDIWFGEMCGDRPLTRAILQSELSLVETPISED